MNENINDKIPVPPVCVIELDDLDYPTSSKSSVDQQVQLSRAEYSRDPVYGADVLKYLSNVLLEDEDVDDKASISRTPADINAVSQSSGDGRPDSCEDVLNYMRRFLLEDDVEEKAGISGYHGDQNLASSKLSTFDSHRRSYKDQDFRDGAVKHMYHGRLEDNVRKEALSIGGPATRSLTSEANSCIVNKHDDVDFSDDVLKYINHILLEEGLEDKTCSFKEFEALQATEKSLYEAMWGQYPVNFDSNLHGFDDLHEGTSLSSQSYSQSSNSSGYGGAATELLDVCSGRHSAMHLNKDVKQGKCIPDDKLAVCLSESEESPNDRVLDSEVWVESGIATQELSNASTGKKHLQTDIPDFLEGRSSKQFAIYRESSIGDDMFDRVLVFRQEKEESAIREEINEAFKATVHEDESKGRKRGKKKRETKKNEADLRTLLTLCAQAVAAEDMRTFNEYLRQIRQHSTPTGDGMQRLAHYFADGLEARMAGSGTQIYKTLINMPVSAADLLKAYHIYLAACPHRKTSNFFSNETILNVAENVGSLYIVDFGTLYGFQWPSFLHKLSSRPGGPPSVRFTAIDFPCPGFRPSQRIRETGRRLASYAKKFNIPFEFNGLAQNWETITIDDIKRRQDEVLVVNCLYRLRYLVDESVIPHCPRDIVLNLIRKMKPAVFVLGIRNGGHNVPFFLTRFREALFHYSSIFDSLDAVISRDRHERMLLERVVFGREAMNVLACEGTERLERPETYKQWQVRLARAGLEVLPLNTEIRATARSQLKLYHKDFVIDDDGYWLLQGWKGRISYALSSWRPASFMN